MATASREKILHKKLRPPVKWHGGKHYLSGRIIDLFPEHHTYLEPFGGAASVLLNKAPSPVEVYNDLDGRITRLFRVLRDDGKELQRRSLGGRGDSFSFTLHRVRRQMADVVSGYLSMIDDQLPLIVERLRTVQIVSRPATDVITTWDSSDTLIYCDPPYVPETRHSGSRNVYGCEMSEAEHRELAEVLMNCKARVLLSGYPSALYDNLYQGWHREEFDIANHAAGAKKKSRETECVWRNYS